MDTNSDHCPICWDEFKEPKLLNCCHSFCCKCLKNYVRRNRGRSELACPLCRQVWEIPERGIDQLITNYFLGDALMTTKVAVSPCGCCRRERVLKTCSHCSQSMCSDCALDHRQALRLAGENDHLTVFDNKEDDDANSDSDEYESMDSARHLSRRNSSTMAIPFSLSIALPPIRTNFKVKPVSTFVVESEIPGSSERPFINCIYPISEDECWIIPTAGPDLVRYTWEGERKQIINLGGIITSVLIQPDGAFLLSLWGDRSIVELVSETMVRGFASAGDIHPHSMSAFPDGRVVFCGPSSKCAEQSDTEKGQTKLNKGSLSLLTRDGYVMKTVSECDDGSAFENPSCVAVSPQFGTIALADKGIGRVFILSEDGTILSQYNGANRRHHYPFLLSVEEDARFLPLNLCFDRGGNLLILDASSRIIHVLNQQGEFVGLMAPEEIDEFSHPFSIAVDHRGRVWLGDEADRCIRVFEMCNYVNKFPRDNGE